MRLRYLPPVASPMASTPLDVAVESKSFPSAGVVVAAAVSVAGIVSAAMLCFCIKRIYLYRYKYRLSTKETGLRRFSFQEIERATSCFSRECLLGSGAFGNVYMGAFDEGGTVLAIKRAHADSYESIREFKNEVELLWRVKHPNLVGLVGYCQEADQKILVYEYVPHGSLLDYIAGKKRKTLSWRQRVGIAIGAAKGIAHLHEGAIIHRDVKPSNILIGEGFEAKVSDFGLVRSGPVGDASHVSSQIKGTPGYLDPAYCSSCHVTPFSDVYSFGVILLQLVSARRAVDNSRPETQYHIVDWARPSLERGAVEEIIDANLLLEACSMEMMLKMGVLALRCVVKLPKDRPTMRLVARELEEAFRGCTAPAINKSMSFSINGVGLERFHVETDDVSVQSVAMRCLDVSGIDAGLSVDFGGGQRGELVGIGEGADGSESPSVPLSRILKIQP